MVAHQAPLSMGFPTQEYWSELPFPSPGDPPSLDEDPDETWVLSYHTKIQSGWDKWNLNSESFDFQISIRLYSLLVPTLPGLLLGATVLAFVLGTEEITKF